MLSADIVSPSELSHADEAAWRALRSGHPDFASPLLGPDFARAVARARPDARVAVFREDGRAVGFLAHHRRPGGLARPIGAPLSDYHALLAEPGLDPAAALQAAGLAAYRFTGLVGADERVGPWVRARQPGYVIHLEDGAEAYLETLRAASPKRFKNYRRLENKADREVGLVRVVVDRSRGTLATLMAWKRAQIARTGLHDFLRPDWTQALMWRLFERGEGALAGMTLSLYFGDRLAAGQFGVREGEWFHPWIAATDPELSVYSPGQVFFLKAIAAMPGLGLSTYDLGPGHEHYKRPYSLATRETAEGQVIAAGARGRGVRISEQAWLMAGARRHGLVGRLHRRLETIAAVDLTLAGRARGLAEAVAARAVRRSEAAEA